MWLVGRKVKNAKRGACTHAPGAKGKTSYVSYCPECTVNNAVHPETSPHVVVQSQRYGSCRSGHRWVIK